MLESRFTLPLHQETGVRTLSPAGIFRVRFWGTIVRYRIVVWYGSTHANILSHIYSMIPRHIISEGFPR
jgi:hypothetical protein